MVTTYGFTLICLSFRRCKERQLACQHSKWGDLLFSHPLLFCRSLMVFGSIFISVLLQRSLEGRHP